MGLRHASRYHAPAFLRGNLFRLTKKRQRLSRCHPLRKKTQAMDAVIASLGEQERYRSCERGGHELSRMPPMSCAGKGKAASASAEILTLR